jgi:phage terminase large subunit
MVTDLFGVRPDVWQEEGLRAFPDSPRLAFKSCTGPGKTAGLAWIGWNYMLTRPHPRCGCGSINGANLAAGLWTELAKWRSKSPLLMQMFEMTKERIFAREHPETWKLEARTWAKDADATQMGNALRGLHGEYVLWLLDETGGYPDSILPVVEAIFSGSPKEAHIVQAGNPTNLSGPLYTACATEARKYWKVIEITGDPDDPRRSPRISVEHARQQIDQYGRDNPWVLVNIFGQFPPSSFNSLIGIEEVRQAMQRKYQQSDIDGAARVLGVDVARFGDDSSVIFPRQGLVAFKPNVMRNLDGNAGAGRVARMWTDWNVDAVFIDNGGGYGASWIDGLARMNRATIPIDFNGAPQDRRYYNRRSEMAFNTVQWIKAGGALPDDPELMGELTQTTYTFKGDRLIIEDKGIIKARLGRSPDRFDGLMLTHAEPVASRGQTEALRRAGIVGARRLAMTAQDELFEAYTR